MKWALTVTGCTSICAGRQTTPRENAVALAAGVGIATGEAASRGGFIFSRLRWLKYPKDLALKSSTA